jgi:hypothetical protein
MRYWQANHPSRHKVLLHLKKSEVSRELENPFRSVTGDDGAKWLLEAKEWYEEDHLAVSPAGKMINFLLHCAFLYHLSLDKEPDPCAFIPQFQNWLHTRTTRTALRIAQSPSEAQHTFSTGFRLSAFDGFKNMVLARLFSKLNERPAVEAFLIVSTACFHLGLDPLTNAYIELYR